jgi:hypothetical protein
MRRGKGKARPPGAENTAEAAELRNHLGKGADGNCGRTVEELRNLSSLFALPPIQLPALRAPLTPSLVHTAEPGKPREGSPAQPPAAAGVPDLAAALPVVVGALLGLSPARWVSVRAQFDQLPGRPAMREEVQAELMALLCAPEAVRACAGLTAARVYRWPRSRAGRRPQSPSGAPCPVVCIRGTWGLF